MSSQTEFYQNSSDDEEFPEQSDADRDMYMKMMLINANKKFFANRELDDIAQKKLKELQEKSKTNEDIRKSFIIKIYISNIHPRIWRRFRVPGSISLDRLHDRVLCPVMGWCRNYHGYYFKELPRAKTAHLPMWEIKVGHAYGPISSGAIDMMHVNTHGIELVDDTKVQLGQILPKVGAKIEYVYDLGDQVRHKLILEKIEDTVDNSVIEIIDGEHACPPEDPGNMHSYAEDLAVLKAGPSHKKYSKTMQRILNSVNYRDESTFDPDQFSLSKTTKKLMLALKSTTSVNVGENMSSFNFLTGQRNKPPFKEQKEIQQRVPHVCAICQAPSTSKCSRCQIVYYCGRDHQKQHWPDHKKNCSKLTD